MMISHGAEISITGGRAGEKDEGDREPFFNFFLYHVFAGLRYKKWHGVLAIVKTKPVNNPTTHFTPSWEKSNPSKQGNISPSSSISDESKTKQYLPPDMEGKRS